VVHEQGGDRQKRILFSAKDQLIFKIRCFLLRYDLDCFAEQTADLLKSIGWKLGIFNKSFCIFTPSLKKLKKQRPGLGDARVNLLGFSLGGAAPSGCLAICLLSSV